MVYNAILLGQTMTKPHDGREFQMDLGKRGTERVSLRRGGGLGQEAAALRLCRAITHHGRQDLEGGVYGAYFRQQGVEPMIDKGTPPTTKTLQVKHRDPLTS